MPKLDNDDKIIWDDEARQPEPAEDFSTTGGCAWECQPPISTGGTMNIQQRLDALADLQAQREYLALTKQEMIDSVLTPEIRAKLAEIEIEFMPQFEAVDSNITAVEAEIKADVVTAGATVKGAHLQAVFMKGRVSWDTKALDGYAAAHPEIAPFRKEGAPSVSIRKV